MGPIGFIGKGNETSDSKIIKKSSSKVGKQATSSEASKTNAKAIDKFHEISESKKSSELENLVENIPPVSKIEAKGVFQGLGENWWKQIFDGKYHQFGAKVFDEGLHGKEKEPGFYESALNAFNFAGEHLGEPLTVDFYCNLHKIACAHFQGKANETLMEAKDAGVFRKGGQDVRMVLGIEKALEFYLKENPEIYPDWNKKFLEMYSKSKGKDLRAIQDEIDMNMRWFKKDPESVELDEIGFSLEIYHKFDAIYNEKILKPLIEYLASQKNSVGGQELPTIYSEPHMQNFVIQYVYALNLEKTVNSLFSEYNSNISEINRQIQNGEELQPLLDKKLSLIADLYQKLEWLHPFQDGQGRTDLIVLSKLLSENGFTPPILDDPYMSSFSPLSNWIEYLKKGMASWAELKSKS